MSGDKVKDALDDLLGPDTDTDTAGPAAPAGVSGLMAGTPVTPTRLSGLMVGVVVESVEVESVVGGVLQRIRLRGIEPKEVAGWLRSQDPGAKWRDDFPMKGQPRETKLARVAVISVASDGSRRSIDLVAQDADGEMKVQVGKKSVDSFLGQIRALNRLPEDEMVKLETAMGGKGQAVVMIRQDAHAFGVKYWSMDDGTRFAEGVCLEVPEMKAKEG